MAKYKRKSSIVDAFKWTGGHNQESYPEWYKDFDAKGQVDESKEIANPYVYDKDGNVVDGVLLANWLEIKTLDGTKKVNQGDYIVRGIQGEIYPCKQDIFEATYEIVKHDNN